MPLYSWPRKAERKWIALELKRYRLDAREKRLDGIPMGERTEERRLIGFAATMLLGRIRGFHEGLKMFLRSEVLGGFVIEANLAVWDWRGRLSRHPTYRAEAEDWYKTFPEQRPAAQVTPGEKRGERQ